MMVLLFALSIAVFLLQHSFANAELVGLRLLYNLGFPQEGSYCSSHELHALKQHVYDAVLSTSSEEENIAENSDDGLRRKLDDGFSFWCNLLCENFPPGQCWLAYPICPNRRNLLRAKADKELQEADNELYEEEPGNGVEIIFDTRSGRTLSDGEYIDMLLDQCNKEIDAAIAWLQGGVEGISSPCNSLLQEHVDFACFKLPN